MPTATLTYNLPEDQGDFDAALNGRKAISALSDIDQWLKGHLKHGEPTADERRMAEAVRQMIPAELLEI